MTTKRYEPSKTYQGTVSSKRQITIPAEIFKQLRLQAGDKVTLTLEDGGVRLAPVQPDFDALLGQYQLPATASRNAHQEIREMRGWTDYDEETGPEK